MKNAAFEAAVQSLRTAAMDLVQTLPSIIAQAERLLEGVEPPLSVGTAEQSAAFALEDAAKRIDRVMHNFDSTLTAIGVVPNYTVFFQCRNLTEEGWRLVQQTIQTHQERD